MLMRPDALAVLDELIPAQRSECRDALLYLMCYVLYAMYYVVQGIYVSYLSYVVQKTLNALIIPYMVMCYVNEILLQYINYFVTNLCSQWVSNIL